LHVVVVLCHIAQDSFIVIPDISKDGGTCGALFGVYDGHGSVGHHVSRFIIAKTPATLNVQKMIKDPSPKANGKLMEDSFKSIHNQVRYRSAVLVGTPSTRTGCAALPVDRRKLRPTAVDRLHGDRPLSASHYTDCP
jgi:serine/threonine protein phosphatase PrpC